jgi:ferredoxin-NADP reductase
MLTPTVFEVTFDTDSELGFKAGQFISIVIPGAGPGGRDLRRAYSIASEPNARPVELCVKLVEGGPGTNYLYKLRPGDVFRGFAPYGDFVFKTPPNKHAFFLATGTGIAPFRSMVFSKSYQEAHPLSTTCILGVRQEAELLYLDDLANYPKLNWVSTVSKPQSSSWKGNVGRLTDYLRKLPDEFPWKDTEFYLCGNGDMIKEVKGILTEKGLGKESIHQEKYY